MLTHRQKQKLARHLSGKQKGHFDSVAWQSYKEAIKSKLPTKKDHDS